MVTMFFMEPEKAGPRTKKICSLQCWVSSEQETPCTCKTKPQQGQHKKKNLKNPNQN